MALHHVLTDKLNGIVVDVISDKAVFAPGVELSIFDAEIVCNIRIRLFRAIKRSDGREIRGVFGLVKVLTKYDDVREEKAKILRSAKECALELSSEDPDDTMSSDTISSGTDEPVDPPTIEPVGVLDLCIGAAPFDQQLYPDATGSPTFVATGLPSGLSLEIDGRLTGTPATTGIGDIVNVTASNESGDDFDTFTLNVYDIPSGTLSGPIQINDGDPVSTALVTDISGSTTLSASGLPPGTALGNDGLLTGTPNGIDVYIVEITATSPCGSVILGTVTVEVIDVGGY